MTENCSWQKEFLGKTPTKPKDPKTNKPAISEEYQSITFELQHFWSCWGTRRGWTLAKDFPLCPEVFLLNSSLSHVLCCPVISQSQCVTSAMWAYHFSSRQVKHCCYWQLQSGQIYQKHGLSLTQQNQGSPRQQAQAPYIQQLGDEDQNWISSNILCPFFLVLCHTLPLAIYPSPKAHSDLLLWRIWLLTLACAFLPQEMEATAT